MNSEVAKQLLEELYSPLNCTMLFADLTTAELIKHAANAFLTTKISFINMVADICEAVGADVTKVAQGIGLTRASEPRSSTRVSATAAIASPKTWLPSCAWPSRTT